MMSIEIIVATSLNNTIGLNNKLPWHLPADLKHFKNLSWGFPIVMGKNTWLSIGKELPGRINIVLTSNAKELNLPETVLSFTNFEEVKTWARKENYNKFIIIGGASIYNQFINECNVLHITRIKSIIEGDTFFPKIDELIWEKTNSIDIEKDEKNIYDYAFERWERK